MIYSNGSTVWANSNSRLAIFEVEDAIVAVMWLKLVCLHLQGALVLLISIQVCVTILG